MNSKSGAPWNYIYCYILKLKYSIHENLFAIVPDVPELTPPQKKKKKMNTKQ